MTDAEFAYHECPKTDTIPVPTYPGSDKLFWLGICDECRGNWVEYQRSSAISYFTEAAQQPASDGQDTPDTNQEQPR